MEMLDAANDESNDNDSRQSSDSAAASIIAGSDDFFTNAALHLEYEAAVERLPLADAAASSSFAMRTVTTSSTTRDDDDGQQQHQQQQQRGLRLGGGQIMATTTTTTHSSSESSFRSDYPGEKLMTTTTPSLLLLAEEEEEDQQQSSSSTSNSEYGQDASFHPALDEQQQHGHRRLHSEDGNDGVVLRETTPSTIGRAILKNKQQLQRSSAMLVAERRKRTLVVYSGPTSLDGTIGKNDIYLKNFDYFIEHGIECHGLGGTEDYDPEQPFEDLNLQYVIVLTREVADRYTASDVGLITKKQTECRAAQHERQRMDGKVLMNDDSLITVLVREDRCYDMESLLLVSRTYDIPNMYDHMVYINCGLAGPKFGPGSPQHWEHLSSWTELYTSLLSDKVQMVGHTINTHYNTVYSPHIQSFLFAVNTAVIDIWLETGAIYECGISNDDFRDDLVKMALVWRYEVGISRVLLSRGYSIAAAFMHQKGSLGTPLIIDNNSTFGRHFGRDEIVHSDVFLEEGVRRLTESSFPEYDDYRRYAILPWDCYVFFKVSRLVPSDIQEVMRYEHLGPVEMVPNDARRSSVKKWRRKAGVSIFGELEKMLRLPGLSYTASGTGGALRCYGRHCQFDEVATATGELVGIVLIGAFVLWYVASATAKVVERKIDLARLKQRKWK